MSRPRRGFLRPRTTELSLAVPRTLALALVLAGLLLAQRAQARDCELSAHINERARDFRTLANECGTDKARGAPGHTYHNAYARFIPGDPRILQSPDMKVFEIGLGCGMPGGVGASVKLWRKYFPNAQIGFAEFDRKCGEEWLQQNSQYNIKLMFGDQSNLTDLARWAEEFPQADLIVDDGGHQPHQQIPSFQVLFEKMLKPAGVYVLEDVETGDPNGVNTPSFVLDLAKKLVLKQGDSTQIQSISFFREAVVFVKAASQHP